MPLASSIFLTLSLALAVVLGPQMRAWSWGPALLALALALGCAAVAHLRAKRRLIDPGVLVIGVLTALWFAWRAWTSPVAELAHADLLLLAGAVGCFLVVRAISISPRAESVFLWGLAGLLLASVVMVGFQIGDPAWSQFRQRPGMWPSAFYGHYNEGANFLIGASFLLLGAAMFGSQGRWTKSVWLLIAIAGVVAVYFTRSRGAILGIVVAVGVLGLLVLIVGARRQARWFAPSMVAFPLLVIAAVIGLFAMWDKAQDMRTEGTKDVADMMDNATRLRNYSLAMETAMLHPWTGGGSRSYSWESLWVWNHEEMGNAGALPEQTHNEILQAATDYGLIGAGLLVVLLAWAGLMTVWNTRFADEPGTTTVPPPTGLAGDAMRVGGLAALAGMLVQSSFSFVFHLFPGAMLLGIAMGRLAEPAMSPARAPWLTKAAGAALCAMLIAGTVMPGVMGTRVYAALYPIYLKSDERPGDGEMSDRLTRAIAIWPQSELHNSRAMIHHRHAVDEGGNVDPVHLEQALDDYLAAATHHPKFPSHQVNAARLLSLRDEAERAEELFRQAAELQGGMEMVFGAYYHMALHHQRKGIARWRHGDPGGAVDALQSAREAVEAARSLTVWFTGDYWSLEVSVFQSLGLALEARGDLDGALECFNVASRTRHGHHVHYHAGRVLMRQANAEWHRRKPETAYPIFVAARQRLLQGRNHLPDGISEEDLMEQLAEVDATLRLLRAAGFGE